MKKVYDFHTHTFLSDGALICSEQIRHAQINNYEEEMEYYAKTYPASFCTRSGFNSFAEELLTVSTKDLFLAIFL